MKTVNEILNDARYSQYELMDTIKGSTVQIIVDSLSKHYEEELTNLTQECESDKESIIETNQERLDKYFDECNDTIFDKVDNIKSILAKIGEKTLPHIHDYLDQIRYELDSLPTDINYELE